MHATSLEPQPDASPEAPRLGIVIVTNDRSERLLETLRTLTNLEANYPIVVVDNASTDGTVESVRRQFPTVRVIERATNIGSVARNDGVHALTTDYVAFSDDDSWYAPGSLAAAIQLLDDHPRLALIMSRVLAGPEETLDPCCDLMSRSPLPRESDTPGIPVLGFLACGAIVRRDAFLEIGGFDQRHGSGGEESWVAWNLAEAFWELRYIPDIIAHHHPAPRSAERMRRRRIEGVASELWSGWTRRRATTALRITARHLRRALTSHEARAGIRRALPDLPASLAQRRPFSRRVEAQIELLERDG